MLFMRALITGGPGAGCTSTAAWVAKALGLAHFDSDEFFHKPTDPPFQEQYGAEERRELIEEALTGERDWILSGSMATWGLGDLELTHGVILDVGPQVRMQRLAQRERQRFGARIYTAGDLGREHEAFMEWAKGYEVRVERGRNAGTDFGYARERCERILAITAEEPLEDLVERVCRFLTGTGEG
jgi:adenylate kinase family enzyme